jgi:hypothetical protein
MGVISRHPILTTCLLIPVSIVLGLLSLFTWSVASSSFQGYYGICWETGRVMGEDELVRSAISQLIHAPYVTVDTRKDGTSYFDTKMRLSYESVEDFLAKNPDCCAIKSFTDSQLRTFTFWERASGEHRAQVSIRYKERFMDSDGITHEVALTEKNTVGNCGHLLLNAPSSDIILGNR